jgi:hypothetical protein
MTRTKIFNIILLTSFSILLAAAVYCSYRLQALSAERVQVKEDYSLSNSVTFGLFSVDQWRDRIAEVIDNKIDGYHITKEQQRDLQKAVEKEMHSLVNQTVAEINKPQKSIGGKLKKLAFNAMVDPSEIHAQVKPFAQTIVKKISSPKSEQRLKDIASSKIDQLEDQIYDSTRVANYAVTQYVYKKYKVSDPITFNQRITTRLEELKAGLIQYTGALLGCVVIALALWWLVRKQVQMRTALFLFSLAFALVLLLTGSLLPVIEVDARIQSLSLDLLGAKVQFQNQVLFYQSKSVWGIVATLIGQPKPDAVVVGVLIMLFVLALPLLRLIAKGIYVLSNKKIARHPVVQYLTFQLEKWDMADVMIVGMLMTYVGLNGIIKSQLSGLNIDSGALKLVTDNGTSLQPGYFLFTAYVLFSILLSYVLKKTSSTDELK